jgi:predicted RecB family nuclease
MIIAMDAGSSITAGIFSAYLKCATKAYLSAIGETAPTVFFATTEARISAAYAMTAVRSIIDGSLGIEPIDFTQVGGNLRSHGDAYFVDCDTALYRCALPPSDGAVRQVKKMMAAQKYFPVVYSAWEKIEPSDTLLVCFGALAISQLTGTIGETGRIIYGRTHRIRTVKIGDHVVRTQALLDAIAAQFAGREPPRLVLNKHCATCDFQTRCRNISIERDDISLLSALSSKERAKCDEKGILTVAQLSYGYRPRRRKRLNSATGRTDEFAKYDHKLKALAIKKAQIHVVGAPSIRIEGTPVFLDVEGMPDRDFYYLIGLRYLRHGEYIEHSFWADSQSDERTIWRDFLRTLQTVDNPKLMHYGAYETRFLKLMKDRYGQEVAEGDFVDRLIERSMNLLSIIYGKIYFPTYSNSVKEIARFLGFKWTHSHASGGAALLMRRCWELDSDQAMKCNLTTYNIEDCRAAEAAAAALIRICEGGEADGCSGVKPVNVSSLEVEFQRTFGKFASPFQDFERINGAAYWDYQRTRVYVRSDKSLRRFVGKENKTRARPPVPIDKKVQIEDDRPLLCQRCKSTTHWISRKNTKIVMNLRLLRNGIKRNIVEYIYSTYRCGKCRAETNRRPTESRLGRELRAYIIYLIIEMRMSHSKIVEHLSSLYRLPITNRDISRIKEEAAKEYEPAYRSIIQGIAAGPIVHVDETRGVIHGGGHYMWVFTNMTSVAYVYAPSRDASVLGDVLAGFKGVLISDFYAAYGSVDCPQQRCLIHLMRDINEDVLKSPFNDELNLIARRFGILLREIVETVDRYGLKARHLRKHKARAKKFLQDMNELNCHSEIADALRKRIVKNRDTLFTFLDYDGVPWNNNNAEHAVRGYTRHRKIMTVSTPKGTREYAILLSIQQTMKFRNQNFLDVLRSGNIQLVAPHLISR